MRGHLRARWWGVDVVDCASRLVEEWPLTPATARTYQNGVMRRLLILLVLGLFVAGCGPNPRSEVRTNSGGILDCPTDTILYAMFNNDVPGPGEPTPIAAAAVFIDSEWLKDGLPRLEGEPDGTAAVSIVDWEGNRVGRALVVEHDSGWHVQAIESCS